MVAFTPPGGGDAIGSGFVAGRRRIITCAHVVSDALGLDRATGATGEILTVTFAHLPGARAATRDARVSHWDPAHDLAGLDLLPGEGRPRGVRPLRLGRHVADAEVSMFGHPPADSGGRWVPATLRGRVAGGLVQVDTAPEATLALQQGFSGGPAVVGGHVVGMLVTAGSGGRRDARVLPYETLRSALSRPSALRASVRDAFSRYLALFRGGPGSKVAAATIGAGVLALTVALGVLIGDALPGGPSSPGAGPTVVSGIMASKEDYFNDAEVIRLLAERGYRVDVTRRGSFEVAQEVIGGGEYDFAFPSGRPPANLITQDRRSRDLFVGSRSLFTSPLVLASFRPYAEALVADGVATPREGQDDEPLYYDLDVDKFVELGLEGRTWDDIGFGRTPSGEGRQNGNVVLAQTTGAGRSNSAATYLALVAFVANGDTAPTPGDVAGLGRRIRPLFEGAGLPQPGIRTKYFSDEGLSQTPVAVIYEHQYFDWQVGQARNEGLDRERVLLYPDREFITDPELVFLTERGKTFAEDVLAEDPELRHRMTELGFRVYVDATAGASGTDQLYAYLEQQGVPVPPDPASLTQAQFPADTGALTELIENATNSEVER
ncbi:hypothetical protein GCM10009751_10150 [Myceligenerans crystallogenes]|uniref:Trypsin-like peptidase domain-containing protein n=2 Tax=Myceligenerans crystallogenes TaxID=316335 RepID=A0ABN2N723_9MICO